jgi:hypothetical protein
MKVHNHSEQFDGALHAVCGRGNKVVTNDEFEATEPNLRCKLCEKDWFPCGQPDWHLKQSQQKVAA